MFIALQSELLEIVFSKNNILPESQSGGLLIKLIHLASLSLVQQSDPLLSLLSELGALLLHLLTQQCAPHTPPPLQLPPLS